MTGLFTELGPCLINKYGNGTVPNPQSWVSNASVFFLDQPLGVGFSYSDPPSSHPHRSTIDKASELEETRGREKSKSTLAAAADIYAFMKIWYASFPDSIRLPFHMSGESYAGHYIPIFASYILAMNALEDEAGGLPIPLTSLIIGNGIFDPRHQVGSSWDIACTNVTGLGPFLNQTVCEGMGRQVERCEYLWDAAYAFPDLLIARTADDFCERALSDPVVDSGINVIPISPLNKLLMYSTMMFRNGVSEIYVILWKKQLRNTSTSNV